MPLYDRLFSALYDRAFERAERAGLTDRRRELLAGLSGSVLEIGAGTGLNLDLYPTDLERLVMTEPSEAMAAKLKQRIAESIAKGQAGEAVIAPAEKLPFDDDSFDAVVSTLVLCTVPEPEETIKEIHRVLRPGGSFVFIEHVRSSDPASAKWQDRLETPWRIFGNGCHCNRDTESLLRNGGFGLDGVQHGEMPKAPAIIRPLIQGRATVLS